MTTYQSGFRVGLTNLFGVIGYIFITLQWGMIVLVYFRWLYEAFITPLTPVTPVEVPQPVVVMPEGSSPPVWVFIFGGFVVFLMIVLSIYAIIKTPSMIANAGKKVVGGAAKQTAGAVLHAQHKKDTPKNRKRITPRLAILFKLLIVLLPLGFAWGSQFIPTQSLSFNVTMVLSAFLASIAFVSFGLQYILALLLKVDYHVLR